MTRISLIDKAVTILAPQDGNSVNGRDAALGIGETTIIGHAEVTATGGSHPRRLALPQRRHDHNGGGGADPTLQIAIGRPHGHQHDLLVDRVQGGNSVPDRAIIDEPDPSGTVTISDN